MAQIIATNFGEFSTAPGDFFENLGTGLTDLFTAGDYTGTPFGFATGAGRGFRITNNNPIVTKSVPAQGEYFAHVRFAITTNLGQTDPIIRFDEGTTNHIDIVQNTDGTIAARRNGTVLATGTTIFSRIANTVLDVQVRVVISDTVGVVQVRMQGSTSNEINFSGDTRNGATGVINRIGFTRPGTSNYTWTDFVINDTTGSDENSWPGPVRVVLGAFTITGGSGVQFTPSASTNVSNIDDVVPGAHDGDTTYNEDSTAGHKDFFQVASTVFTGMSPALIHAVRTKYWARAADGGAHTFRSGAKNGGTQVNGVTINLGSSYQLFEDVFYKDPNTSALWATFAAIYGAEFDYELVS